MLYDQNMFIHKLLKLEIIFNWRILYEYVSQIWTLFTFIFRKYSKLFVYREKMKRAVLRRIPRVVGYATNKILRRRREPRYWSRRVSNVLSQIAKRGSSWNGARYIHESVNINSRVLLAECYTECQIQDCSRESITIISIRSYTRYKYEMRF